MRSAVRGADPPASQPPRRLPRARLGHGRRLDRARRPEAACGLVLPRLAFHSIVTRVAGIRQHDARWRCRARVPEQVSRPRRHRCRRAAPRPPVHLSVRLAALGLRSVRPTQLRRGSARVPIYLEIARGIPERRNSHDAKPGSQSRQELPQRSAHQPWRKKLELGSLTQSSRGRRKSKSHYREVQSRRK